MKLKKSHNYHNLLIICGKVGAGKSALAEGLAALDANMSNQTLTFDNIAWRIQPFIEKMDDSDNIGAPLIFDESIMGATGRSMGTTSLGIKLRIGLITRRWKLHTYVLLVDEINELSDKLIRMCDVFINVRTMGIKRGYFDCYTNKSKIEFLFNAFKQHKKTWNSKVVRNIKPDCKGKFPDYSGMFFNKKEYSEMKDKETKQMEDNGNNKERKKTQVIVDVMGGMTQADASKKHSVPLGTVARWMSEFKAHA